MTAGLQVIGSHGVLQIDELFRNLAVRDKGTGPTLAANGGGYTIRSSVPGVTPLLAARCVGVGNELLQAYMGIDPATQLPSWSNRVPWPNATEWWHFDTPPAVTANYGLVVYRSDGSVAFDATRDYMRVVGALTIGSTPNSTFRQPAGKKYAWVQYDIGFWEGSSGPTTVEQGGWHVGMDANGDLYRQQSLPLDSHSGTASAPSRSPQVFVVDVTGL